MNTVVQVNIRTPGGASPVDAAIEGGCAGLLLELVYAGADLSALDSKGYVHNFEPL